jgi:PAS domain S-box-containing protein
VAQSIHRINQMEKIRASEEQFRSIVESVQDVVMLTGPSGEITYLSPSSTEIFGYAPESMEHTMWGDLVHGEDLGRVEEFLARSLSGERGSIKEYRVVTGGGETRWVSHSWTPLLRDGEVRLVVSAINDITWRKRTEEALRASLDELEQTNRDLSDFTHVVSHDLKSPLMTIESFSSFLLEDYWDALDDEGRDYLSRVTEASGRMASLIDDLLTLSRVGRKFTEYTRVDMGRLLEEALEDLAAQIRESGAVVKAQPMPAIVAQEVWVKQLLVNLIGNGIKFNESRPPRVEVTYRDAGDAHQFSVKDNGIGIPEDQRGLLFRVFQRLPTEREYPGTGAGLSICKKIVESMGGTIGVDSQEGFGSNFHFTIPKDLPAGGEQPRDSDELRAAALGRYL